MCSRIFPCSIFFGRDLEGEIEDAIDEVRSQHDLFRRSVKISNDLSVNWNIRYIKYIESLEEYLRQVRIRKAIDKFSSVLDISYEIYEYPKTSILTGYNLPVAPLDKDMNRE